MAIKSKKQKITGRDRSRIRIRRRILESSDRPRLTVYKSSKHIYAQVVNDATSQTLVSASTTEDEVKKSIKEGKRPEGANDLQSSKSVNAARAVGLILAKRAMEKNIKAVVFDRNGFIYTGRVQAVADAAREGGLEF